MTDQDKKDERYKQRQSKIKDNVDKRVENAQTEKGLLIVVTGNGKGKTTSGFGTVARAVGHGLNCVVAQFIKGTWDCGERNLLEGHGVPFHVMKTGFTWNTQDKTADTEAAQRVWQECKKSLADESVDLVLLDEMTYMVTYGYIDLDELKIALSNRPKMQSVVITGRAAHRDLIEIADTVSEVRSVKHAFDSGVKALKGIDW